MSGAVVPPPNTGMGLNPLHALMMRQQQQMQHPMAQNPIPSHAAAPTQSFLDQMLGGGGRGANNSQTQQQLMERLLLQTRGFPPQQEAEMKSDGLPPQAASLPAAAGGQPPQGDDQEMKEDGARGTDPPQFTTAQELMMRVLRQNQGK